MDTINNKKRKAEDEVERLEESEKKDIVGSEEKKESSAIDTSTATTKSDSAPAPSGFAAYAKTNPFQAAAAGLKQSSFGSGGFGNGFGKGFGTGFDSNNSNANSGSGKFGSSSSGLTINSSLPSTRPNFTMPPPLVVPSPKSPKMNPFSSPSPAHNPFMTIVDSKDELWKTMAKDKLTEEDIVKSNNLQFTRTNSSKRQRTFGGGSTDGYGSETSRSAERKSFSEDDDPLRRHSNESTASSAPLTSSSAHRSTHGNNHDATHGVTTTKEEEDDNGADEEEGGEDDGPSSDFVPTKTYSLPENVPVVTGEEEDECLLQTRAKLYRLTCRVSSAGGGGSSVNDASDVNNMEWVEVGVGPLKILQRADSGEKLVGRMVLRREDKKGGVGTKLLINTRLNQFVTVARQGDKMIRMLCVNHADDSVISSSAPTGQQHALLTAFDQSSTSTTSPTSSRSASVGTHSSSSNNIPQTFLLKMSDPKDCEDILKLVTEFSSRSTANQSKPAPTVDATESLDHKASD